MRATPSTLRISSLVLGAVMAASLAACGSTPHAAPAATVTVTAASGTTGADAPAATAGTTSEGSTSPASGATSHRATSGASGSATSTTKTTQPVPATTKAGGPSAPETMSEGNPDSASDVELTLGIETHPGLRGFGHAQPSHVFLGGDPTGDVSKITWSSWGEPEATGTGMGYYLAPGEGTYQAAAAKVTIRAWDIGECDGKTVYRKVQWHFVGKTENAYTDVIDACDR